MPDITEWHPKIYGGKRKKTRVTTKSFLWQYAKQFKYTCQACRRRFSLQSLSLHHMVPRSEGGNDEPSNLILLCWDCHDKIEPQWRKYKSYNGICYAFAKRRHKDLAIRKKQAGIDWHEWVYGGKRNPKNG